MKYYTFPCGCKFPVEEIDDEVRVKFDPQLKNIPLDCERTWDLISDGILKGTFQLESNLGKSYAKKLKPRNIEHLSALIALIRPGCISGDTRIMTHITTRKKHAGTYNYVRSSMEDVFKKKPKRIVSYNEETGKLQYNNVINIVKTGTKPVYKILFRKTLRKTINKQHLSYYDLKCTLDHRILTPDGWKPLQNMKQGDRFAIIKYRGSQKPSKNIPGEKSFQHICFKHYKKHCVFCDWQLGTLDVNHITGNRKTDNNPDNLHFICPNHHRMYTEKNITPQQIIEARKQYTLPQKEDIEWGEYIDKELVQNTEVYDIEMEAPHHNFIAGNTVVHNCLDNIVDGKSVTQHYIDRKNGVDPVTYFHPALEEILKDTQGLLVYQESTLKIAQKIAGFDLVKADILRKAIGKKKADLMASLKDDFISGAVTKGLVNKEEAEEIFRWIEASSRYAFNKSHSVSYAMNTYTSAYIKAHFPRAFYTSWLRYAHGKPKPFVEISELANDAKLKDIELYPPDIRHLNPHFKLIDKNIYFGLVDVKGIGDSVLKKLNKILTEVNTSLNKTVDSLVWSEFLVFVSQNVNSKGIKALISCGALGYMGVSRTKMLYEFDVYAKLTKKEKPFCENLVINNPQLTLMDILEALIKVPTGRHGGCSSVKRLEKVQGLIHSLRVPSYRLEDTPAWISGVEEELLGLPITCASIESCDISAANCSCKEFLKGYKPRGVALIAATIDVVNEIKTKRGKNPGQKMAFITASDITGCIDSVVAFPETWLEHKRLLTEGNHVMLQGEQGQEPGSLILKKVYQI